MPFTPAPLIPSDLYDGAARLARDAAQELVRLTEPGARAVAIGRRWHQIQALGWPMLMLPEAAGGAGGTLEDVVALIDGAAQEALPLPLSAICGIAPILLSAARPAGLAVLEGEAPIPILDAYAGWMPRPDPPCAIRDPSGSLHLAGSASGVDTLLEPGSFLLACPLQDDGSDDAALIVIPGGSLQQRPRLFERMDGRLGADIDLDGTVLPATALLAQGPGVAQAIDAALDTGAFLSCVEVSAALGHALELVVGYLSDRNQFGVALSTFQALRHKVAELYVIHETLRATVVHLLHAADTNGRLPSRDVSLAKLHFGRAARRAAEKIIQLHGGMGMTEELPATRLNKRLMMAEFEFGDAAWHARKLLPHAA